MKKSLSRIGLIALEGIGVILAVLVAFIGFALWQVEQHPVSLNIFRPAVEHLVSKKLPDDYALDIKSITLQSSGAQDHTYLLVLGGIELGGTRDNSAIIVPEATLTIDKYKILKSGSSLIAIDVSVLDITAIRGPVVPNSDNQRPNQPAKPSSNLATFLQNLQEHPVLSSSLERLTVDDIKIQYTDNVADQKWSATSGTFQFDRAPSNLIEIKSSVNFVTAKGPANIELTVDNRGPDGIFKARLDGKQMPVGDIASLILRQPQSDFTAPVSGTISGAIDRDGEIVAAQIDIGTDQGKIRIGGEYLPIIATRLNGFYNPQAEQIEISNFGFGVGKSVGAIKGTIKLDRTGSKTQPAIRFDLTGSDVSLDTLGFFNAPLAVKSLIAKGYYQTARRLIAFDELVIDTDDIGFSGSLAIERPRPIAGKSVSPGIVAQLKSRGRIDHQRLLELWPPQLSPRARDWVRDQIKNGFVENLDFEMDLPPGKRGEIGYIPDETLTLNFDVGGATAEYIPGMSVLTNGYGHGLLRGNSLHIEVERGRVKDIDITSGLVHFTKFHPAGEPAVYAFDAKGSARQMLDLLNEKPLRLLAKAGFDPAQVAGVANAKVRLTRRFRGNGVPAILTVDSTAQFSDLILLEAWGDLDLNNGNGTVRITTEELTIDAQALLGATPVSVKWGQRFGTPTSSSSSLSIAGEFDAATADLVGIPTRSFLSGPVAISIDAEGAFRQFDNIHLTADFTKASLLFPAYGWQKAVDIPASMKLDLNYDKDRNQSGIVSISGEGLAIEGAYSLFSDGRLSSIKVPKFQIAQHADFGFEATRERGQALSASVSGRYINIAPIIEDYFDQRAIIVQQETGTDIATDIAIVESQSVNDAGDAVIEEANNWGRGINARLRFDRLGLRNGVEIADASLDVWHDSKRLEVFSLSGFDRSTRPVSVLLSQAGDTTQDGRSDGQRAQRIVEAQTTDIGNLLSGIFAISSLRGGDGNLRLVLGDGPQADLSGTLSARNLYIVDAPIMAKLFAASSLDGLTDLVNNQGIELEEASADFLIADGVIKISDANAIGPSFGISSSGTIGLDGGEVDLSGALAPIYQINSFLGKTPLIGGLLVNRKGEGILALSYKISGDVAAPSVTIKPLSALAPGFLRRAFEQTEETTEPDEE